MRERCTQIEVLIIYEDIVIVGINFSPVHLAINFVYIYDTNRINIHCFNIRLLSDDKDTFHNNNKFCTFIKLQCDRHYRCILPVD